MPGRLRTLVTGERLFALLFVLVGIVAIAEGIGYGFIRSDGIIGPGFLPICTGAVVTALGAGIVLQTFRAAPAPSAPLDAVEEEAASLDSDAAPAVAVEGSQRSALIVFVGIGVALFISEWLGLIVALGILAFLVLLFIEKQGLVRSALVAAALSFGTWVVFVHFLEVPIGSYFSPQ